MEVQKLGPGGQIPEELKARVKEIEWTYFMQEIFDYLHENKVKKILNGLIRAYSKIILLIAPKPLFLRTFFHYL